MQIDFQYNSVRYMLNFDNYHCLKYMSEGVRAVEIRIYYSLDSDSSYGSSIKEIKNNKIVWHEWDDTRLSIDAQYYIDRMVSMRVFA
jgi:hypothetical protein